MFAQQLVGGGSELTAWLQASAQVTGLAFMMWWFARAFPAYQQAYRDERDKQQVAFLAALTAQNDAFERRASEMTDAVKSQTMEFRDAIKEQTKDFAKSFGSDPRGLCKAVEALKTSGICKAEDAEKIAEMFIRMREKHGDGNQTNG